MLLTLAIFVVGIVAVVAFGPRDHRSSVATPVAFSVSLAALRSAAPFPVYAPATVPAGWTPNHVATHVPDAADPAYSLDLGFYLAGSKQYVAVEQSDAVGFLVAQLGTAGRETGAETVAGTSWQTWIDSHGFPALVRSVGGSTLVLDGQADAATLRTLAGALSLLPAHDVPGAV